MTGQPTKPLKLTADQVAVDQLARTIDPEAWEDMDCGKMQRFRARETARLVLAAGYQPTEDRAAHVEREAVDVAHAVQRYLREFYGTSDVPGVLNLAAVIEHALAALPQTGDAAAVARVEALAARWDAEADQPGGHNLLVQTYRIHAREVRAALTAGADQ